MTGLLGLFMLLFTQAIYAGVGDSIGVEVIATAFIIYSIVFVAIAIIVIKFSFKRTKFDGYMSILILIVLYPFLLSLLLSS